MVTPNERGILEIAAENDGEASFGKLCSKMGLNSEIISVTCKSLEARGYVQLPGGRRITLTTKGLQAAPKPAEEGLMQSKKFKGFDEQTLREIEQEVCKGKRGWTQRPLIE